MENLHFWRTSYMLGDADGIYPAGTQEFDTKEEAEAAGTAGQTVLAVVKIKEIPAEVAKDETGAVLSITTGGLSFASVDELTAVLDWSEGYTGGVVNFWPIESAETAENS